MKVLVVGGSGFIGRFLVEGLLKQGHQVRCLAPSGHPLRGLDTRPVELVPGNICEIDTLYPVVKDMDVIIHLAGVMRALDEETYTRINLIGSRNLIDATLKNNKGLERFVFVSSQAVTGPSPDGHPVEENEPCHPISSYGRSKYAVEQYLQSLEQPIPFTILRLALVFGPNQYDRSVKSFLFGATRLGVFPKFMGDGRLNIIDIDDAVDGIVLAAFQEQARNQIYFLASEPPVSWQEIAELTFQIRNSRGITIPVPRPAIQLIISIIRTYFWLRRRATDQIDDLVAQMTAAHWICSIEKARRELGFDPKVTLKETIRKSVLWYDNLRDQSIPDGYKWWESVK